MSKVRALFNKKKQTSEIELKLETEIMDDKNLRRLYESVKEDNAVNLKKLFDEGIKFDQQTLTNAMLYAIKSRAPEAVLFLLKNGVKAENKIVDAAIDSYDDEDESLVNERKIHGLIMLAYFKSTLEDDLCDITVSKFKAVRMFKEVKDKVSASIPNFNLLGSRKESLILANLLWDCVEKGASPVEFAKVYEKDLKKSNLKTFFVRQIFELIYGETPKQLRSTLQNV